MKLFDLKKGDIKLLKRIHVEKIYAEVLLINNTSLFKLLSTMQ